jgi:poly(3-hydroxybutyrate) depolymerase
MLDESTVHLALWQLYMFGRQGSKAVASVSGILDAKPGIRLNPEPHLSVSQPGVVSLRDGALLFVPSSYFTSNKGNNVPLIVALHGAGGNARDGLYFTQREADNVGALVLAPSSEGRSWDFIRSDFGPDVRNIDLRVSEAVGSSG